MSDRENEIREFIVERFLLGDDRRLDNGESLLEAGVVDSTGVLEIIEHLEHRYGIKVSDDELLPENLDSVSNIVAFVGRKIA